jgi:rRNA-processing protein FCF1
MSNEPRDAKPTPLQEAMEEWRLTDLRRLVDENNALRAELARVEQWRETVIDALVVDFIYVKEHDTDPRKALADLINWEVKVALDPAVSEDARRLIEQGRQELRAELEKVRGERDAYAKNLRDAQGDIEQEVAAREAAEQHIATQDLEPTHD